MQAPVNGQKVEAIITIPPPLHSSSDLPLLFTASFNGLTHSNFTPAGQSGGYFVPDELEGTVEPSGTIGFSISGVSVAESAS